MHQARIVSLFMLPIALGGCAYPSSRVEIDPSTKTRQIAWDGLGQDPNRPRRAGKHVQVSSVEDDAVSKREQVMASLRPYSAAWWVVHDEIEADQNSRLARKLVICRGCLDQSTDEHTGSIPADGPFGRSK
jgi:hypothetical protein